MVSDSDQQTIVNYHNELRQKLADGQVPGQPRATDMGYLKWDTELSNLAQSWANRQQFQHNPNRSHSQLPSVGENIFMAWTSNFNDKKVDWKGAINSWFDEYKKYRYGPIGNVSGTGHYTQVAWSKTTHVGCGASQFNNQGMLATLIVCNYGPAGNYMGQYPYKI